MARSPAERRLLHILSDEDYGPKLARLRGEDERYILRLIDQNKGKEARREIIRLDEERRARERAKRERKRQPPRREPPRGLTRRERERRAIANILSAFSGLANRRRVRDHVGYMTDDELDFAASANADALRTKAQQRADRRTSTGDDLNPFWYH